MRAVLRCFSRFNFVSLKYSEARSDDSGEEKSSFFNLAIFDISHKK